MPRRPSSAICCCVTRARIKAEIATLRNHLAYLTRRRRCGTPPRGDSAAEAEAQQRVRATFECMEMER